MKSFLRLSAWALLLLVSMNVLGEAEGKSRDRDEDKAPPEVAVNLSPEMQKREKAFAKAFKKLSKDEKALVTEMEIAFRKTASPQVQVLKLASHIEACDFKDDEEIAAKSALSAFRKSAEEQQVILWGTFEQKYRPMVDFMDYARLREHLVLKLKVETATAAQIVRFNATRTERKVQCAEAKRVLEEIALNSNSASSGENTADTAEEEEQTSGNPQIEKSQDSGESEESEGIKKPEKQKSGQQNKKGPKKVPDEEAETEQEESEQE